MILNEKQMDAISYGKIAMEQAEEGFVFKRINADQQKAFGRGATLPGQSDEQHALYAAMCDCMAGVVLDFETDSPYVNFLISNFKVLVGITNYTNVLVNGKTVVREAEPGNLTVTLKKPGRVTFVGPYHATMQLRVEVADGSTVKPVAKKALWLMHGDSITHGALAVDSANALAARLNIQYGYDIVNQGIAGYVHDYDTLDRLDRRPDVITTAYGINDTMGLPGEDVRKNIDAYYAKMKDLFPDVPIIVVLPIFSTLMNKHEFDGRFAYMTETYELLTKKYDLPVINGRDLIPNYAYFLKDGVHPNDRGFALYAKNLCERVEQMLKSR